MTYGSPVNEKDHFIEWSQDGEEKYYQILQTEPFQFKSSEGKTNPFTSVANGSESDFQEITDLEPDDDQIYQVLWGIKDGCRYFAQIPAGDYRYGVHENVTIGSVDNVKSPYFRPSPSYEFWLRKGNRPRFNCDNDCGATVDPDIYFEGTKYKVKEVAKEDVKGNLYRRIGFGLTTT